MLELTYVAVLFAAFAVAYLGVIKERRPVILNPTGMLLFALLAYSSFGITPSFGSGAAVNQPGMFILGIGGVLIMLVFTLEAAINELPTVRGSDAPSAGTGESRLSKLLNGNNRL